MHDLSKFRPSEFFPYANYFFKDLEEEYYCSVVISEQIKARFNRAWLFHIHRNKHHWQYWLLYKETNIPIPVTYLLEMVADWRAVDFQKKQDRNVLGWYLANKHNINLTSINRRFVEKKLYETVTKLGRYRLEI